MLLQVPHDRPVVSQRMIETWIEAAEQGEDGFGAQAGKQQQQQPTQQPQHTQQPAADGIQASGVSVS